jgi:hypothetical protein
MQHFYIYRFLYSLSQVPWSRTHEKNKQEKETKVTFYKNKFLRFFYEYIFASKHTDKKNLNSSYLRKFRVELLQSHI